MFERVTLRGRRGSIAWAGAPVAELQRWTAIRAQRGARTWTLTAYVTRADTWRLKQTPLLFEAPRLEKPRGLWCFPILGVVTIRGAQLTAQLGQPEGR